MQHWNHTSASFLLRPKLAETKMCSRSQKSCYQSDPGYHLRTFANQGKEQRRALTESATESVLPASTAAHSTGFKPFLLASKFLLSLLSHSQLHPWRKKVLRVEDRGRRLPIGGGWSSTNRKNSRCVAPSTTSPRAQSANPALYQLTFLLCFCH